MRVNEFPYFRYDHLGSTSVVTDASGAVVERDSYGAHLKAALSGDDDFSVKAYSVDQAKFQDAIATMESFNGTEYDLDTRSCGTAALQTLNVTGIVPGAFYLPYTPPGLLYDAIKRGGP